ERINQAVTFFDGKKHPVFAANRSFSKIHIANLFFSVLHSKPFLPLFFLLLSLLLSFRQPRTF
ncbi:MAG: hypothetical protein J5606_01860, partial [Bacteroidales bacterium]|nr:hypothetical protein [Bacteroidales bacterium]